MAFRLSVLACLLSVAAAACGMGASETGSRLIKDTLGTDVAQIRPAAGTSSSEPLPAPGQAPQALQGPQLVEASPGQEDLREVPVQAAKAMVVPNDTGSRSVRVSVEWTSGPAPCHVFDHSTVDIGGTVIHIHLYEGSAPRVICQPEVVQKMTDVDVGELPAGTYGLLVGPSTKEKQASVESTFVVP